VPPARQAREIWPDVGFQMQHFYTLRIEAYAALLEGQPEDALRTVLERWNELSRSQLLRHVLIGLDAHLLAARCHLAAAQRGREPALIERARWHARRVLRAGTPTAFGWSEMLHAVADLIAGDAAAAERLRRASLLFARCDMKLAEAAARHLLGRITPADGGAVHLAQAEAIFSAAGVGDVATHMRLHGAAQ